MIGNMAVRVTADRANFPLGTLFVRRGSAANVALVGVPVRAGVDVGGVVLRVENVDGATADFAARQFGSVWVVDLPAAHFSTVGGVTGGVSVWATGTGADGETSRTWCLGVGDLEVLTADADAPAPAPGQTFWPLRMFDAAPTTPTKYNAYIDDRALKIWNGAAWVTISGGSINVDDAVTRTGANPVKSSGVWGAIWGALTLLPTGFSSLYDWCVAQLMAKRDYGDLSYKRQDPSEGGWILHIDGNDVRLLPAGELTWTDTGSETSGTYNLKWFGQWHLAYVTGSGVDACADLESPEDATELTLVSTSDYETVVATATAASVEDALALSSEVSGKQDALTEAQLAAANSGATAAKVATWDGYAAQIAQKADAADLRYRIAEAAAVQIGWEVPDDLFPIGFTFEGTAYSIPLSSKGDVSLRFSYGNLWYLTCLADGISISVAAFDNGVFLSEQLDVEGTLTFNNTRPVVGTTSLDPDYGYTVADRTVNLIAATGETSIDIELPEAVTVDGVRRARDFILDIDNSANASNLALEFTALGVSYAFVPLEDDSISEMMTIGSGERVRLYFTETPYTASGSLPVINVARVTLGDFVTSTTTQGGN